MKTYHRWEDIRHKGTPEQRAMINAAARAELDRIGFGALRKAREQTQVELAERLGLPQASISDIENRTDLLLSTLAKYIHALGGELQMQAVFPEATFNLLPPEGVLAQVESLRKKSRSTGKPVAKTSAKSAAKKRSPAKALLAAD